MKYGLAGGYLVRQGMLKNRRKKNVEKNEYPAMNINLMQGQ